MWTKRVVKFFWYQELGHAKVVSRAYSGISQAAMFFTFLKVYDVTLSIPVMAAVFVSWYLVGALCGVLYARMDLLKYETELNNENNPTLKSIHKTIGGVNAIKA